MTAETHDVEGAPNEAGSKPRAPYSFRLPLPRGNEDHLDIFGEAGADFGTDLAEPVAAQLRQAPRKGVATVSDFAKKLMASGLAALASVVAVRAQRFGLRPETMIEKYLIANVRSDLEIACGDLRRRGFRENQVQRFRGGAWRAFKLALREAGQSRRH